MPENTTQSKAPAPRQSNARMLLVMLFGFLVTCYIIYKQTDIGVAVSRKYVPRMTVAQRYQMQQIQIDKASESGSMVLKDTLTGNTSTHHVSLKHIAELNAHIDGMIARLENARMSGEALTMDTMPAYLDQELASDLQRLVGDYLLYQHLMKSL